MSESKLIAIKMELQNQCAELKAREKDILGMLAGIQSDMQRALGAIGALNGDNAISRADSGTPENGEEAKKSAQKPSPRKPQVASLIVEALSHGGQLSEGDLKSQVVARLRDTGHSLRALSLRFRQALSDEMFLKTDEGICLKPGMEMSSAGNQGKERTRNQ